MHDHVNASTIGTGRNVRTKRQRCRSSTLPAQELPQCKGNVSNALEGPKRKPTLRLTYLAEVVIHRAVRCASPRVSGDVARSATNSSSRMTSSWDVGADHSSRYFLCFEQAIQTSSRIVVRLEVYAK